MPKHGDKKFSLMCFIKRNRKGTIPGQKLFRTNWLVICSNKLPSEDCVFFVLFLFIVVVLFVFLFAFYFLFLFRFKKHMKQIIIIIMSCRYHGYPWPSLATSPYHSSPLASLQGYIPHPHIAAVCRFELVVLLLPSHMWGSIGVHHLWARPCFSSCVLHVCFV